MPHFAGKPINRRRRRLVPVAGALPTQSQLKSRERRLPGSRSAVVACTLRSRATVPPCFSRSSATVTCLPLSLRSSIHLRVRPQIKRRQRRLQRRLMPPLERRTRSQACLSANFATSAERRLYGQRGRQRNQKVLSGANQAPVC
jgi:hypothetical protein